MQFNFNKKTENFLKLILKNALNQKIRVFFVGGAVRDNLLGFEIKDVDIIILGNALEFCSKIPELKVKSVHQEFYTVKVDYEGEIFDIASTRVEEYPYSGCLPVVTKIGVQIDKDVIRRDFTVNSMYCELDLIENKITYKLIDLVNGVEDIKNKQLKVLHEKSYIDDPTRIIRGLGFKYRFDFDFSIKDKSLIENYLKNPDRTNMSFSRVGEVFKKVFCLNCAIDLFSEVIEKKYYRILSDNISSVDLHRVKKIISDFSLDKLQIAEFLFAIIEDKTVETVKTDSLLQLLKIFSKYKRENLAYYFYKTDDANVLEYLKASKISLNISGDDLIALGYKKGKLFSEILNALLLQKLKYPLKFPDKEAEEAFILSTFPLN